MSPARAVQFTTSRFVPELFDNTRITDPGACGAGNAFPCPAFTVTVVAPAVKSALNVARAGE